MQFHEFEKRSRKSIKRTSKRTAYHKLQKGRKLFTSPTVQQGSKRCFLPDSRIAFSFPFHQNPLKPCLLIQPRGFKGKARGAQMSRPCHQGSKGKPPEPPTSCQSQQNQNNQVHAEKTYPKTYLIHRTMPVVRTAQVFTRCCKRDLWRFKISKVGKTCTPTITGPPLPRRFLTRFPRLRHGLL